MIVAFIDQHTCKIFTTMVEVPPGAITFSSAEELGRAVSAGTLDRIRGILLGETVEQSSSADQAAVRLWYVLALGLPTYTGEYIGKWHRQKDDFGNFKIADNSRIELIQLTYRPGRDHMVDFFYKKLPPQARKIVDILVDDDRGIWTNEEANAVVLRRASEIKTKQEPSAIFTYYKAELFTKKLLKRVTFSEFISKPEFSGITLDEA